LFRLSLSFSNFLFISFFFLLVLLPLAFYSSVILLFRQRTINPYLDAGEHHPRPGLLLRFL
jgi:hypothetical protein